MYLKVISFTLLAALSSAEPPVQGYNYSPNSFHSGFNPPSTNYGTPHEGYNPPSHNYLPPALGPTSSGGYDPYSAQGHNSHNYHDHDNEVPKAYEFGYSVKDAHSGNDYDRHEMSDGNVVKGEYRVQLPDGRTQIVTYHADWKTGFHADVRYEGEAKYPEPSYQQGYNYNTPSGFGGSLSGFHGNVNNGYQRPSTAYGPPGYH